VARSESAVRAHSSRPHLPSAAGSSVPAARNSRVPAPEANDQAASPSARAEDCAEKASRIAADASNTLRIRI
jgi:hypothetical protein